MIASLAAGVCSERVRLLTGTPKAQVSARKRSGNRTADLSGRLLIDIRGASSELWRVVAPSLEVPTEGERRGNASDLSGPRTEGRHVHGSAVFCLGGPMGRRTPLFELHQELGARIVDFGGWDMPVQYSSQITEHHAVRRAAGVFDVSHMCPIDLKGTRVREFLRHLLANAIAKLKRPGKALYSCRLT